MRVFVTGASGWVGSAVTRDLLAAGHQVAGLARSDASAAAVAATGAEVVRGTLDDLDVLRDAAAASDGVIHTRFRHDVAFSGDFAGAVASDRAAIDAIGAALAGSDRPLVIASGTGAVAPGRLATEDMTSTGETVASHRMENERVALALADVRRAHLVGAPAAHRPRRRRPRLHRHHRRGSPASAARSTTSATAPTGGPQRTASTPRACSCSPSSKRRPGRCCTRSPSRACRSREIAAAISRGLGVPAVSVTAERAAAELGFIGSFLGLDVPASSERTRALLGWEPTGPTLLEDLEAGHYFRARAAA